MSEGVKTNTFMLMLKDDRMGEVKPTFAEIGKVTGPTQTDFKCRLALLIARVVEIHAMVGTLLAMV